MELKELRKGYTTGTCAQAAAKAAVMMLTSGKIVETVNVATASGAKLNINLSDQEIGAGFAHCSVIKDSGDDPDITNGLGYPAHAFSAFKAQKNGPDMPYYGKSSAQHCHFVIAGKRF